MMTKLEKFAIKWLCKNYNDIEPFTKKEYPDYIFYMKDGKCIFDYNEKNWYVHVSYGEIWSFFESFFGMKYQQIRDLTKVWVEEHYNLRVTTTTMSQQLAHHRWRNTTI